MKERLLEFAERFNALTLRERATVAGGVLVGGLLIGYLVLIDPQLARQAGQAKRIAQLKTDMAAAETQIAALQAQLQDPDASNRAALQEVRKNMAAIDVRLRNIQDSLVMPEKMQAFLEGLLSKNRNLELLALHTLPVVELIDQTSKKKKLDGKEIKESNEAKAPAAQVAPAGDKSITNIYKHAIEIRIAGGYVDLVKYLSELEGMPQRIIWERADLTVEKYPRCVLTLTVYTLSLDKQWLIV